MRLTPTVLTALFLAAAAVACTDEPEVALSADGTDDAGGKMFGVLVVADADGRVGWLRAFSGMLRGAWFVDGFAPPLFDPADRDRFWPAGEAALAADTAAVAAAAAPASTSPPTSTATSR